ncbi:hypothetical protein Trydic_g6943 [Trypoxylus dichotomus]
MRFLVKFQTAQPPPSSGRVSNQLLTNLRFLRGKAMGEVGLVGRGTALSPDSDCNSNHPGSASCFSNTSSQDIDFIQDNDYQWFLDYGYRDNHHTSILSLPESYEANDIGYYDAFAKNMDANLAEADMESFRTEDIHALLTNLPPMCTDHLSQENNRQGESFASVSGSMMAKFDFDSSISPHSSSQGEDSANSTSMSICKSELLFSPVKETPMPGANFSVDSLDCDLLNEHDIMLTCQANKDNYTIAFEGSVTMYSEDSDFHETDKSEASGVGSANWTNDLHKNVRNLKTMDTSMTKSDCSTFTTWRNNNQSSDETCYSLGENPLKSQSMPNLYKQKLMNLLATSSLKKGCNLSNSSSDTCTVKRRPVKVFDIQHQAQHTSGNGTEFSDMATSVDAGSTSSCSENVNKQQNFSLVKLFMKQKSMSAEGMSTALDHSSNSENWPVTQSSDSNISEAKPFSDQRKLLEQELEDSLLDQKIACNNIKSYDIILEDQEQNMSRSESVEQLSESTGKSESMENSSEYYGCSYNLNNNIDNKKNFKSKSTNTKRNNSLGISLSSDSTNSSYTERKHKFSKHVSVNLMNRSMQTSFPEVLKNVPYKLNCNNVKESVKVVEPSFLTKLKEESEIPKPVYILYPSYALPNLDFLKNKDEDLTKVLLMPQQHKTAIPERRRPFSCNDFEALKKKGFAHIQDWESLNVLLPSEYKKVLADVPEVAQYMHKKEHNRRKNKRPLSCEYGVLERTNSLDRASSTSSTTTQPSSGYRGSSTMLLTDSQGSPATTNLNPLFVYRYDSVTSSEASLLTSEKQRSITTTAAPPLPKRSISLADQNRLEIVPPRPPLPRGILRKGEKLLSTQTKRYSMVETVSKDEELSKLYHEPYFLPRNKRLSETEDEGVDAGTSSSSLDEQQEVYSTLSRNPVFTNLSCEDIVQLEEFLKLSGMSLVSDSEEPDEESLMQLRSCVSRFLALRINQDCSKKSVSFAERVRVLPKIAEPKFTTAPNNSPNVSAMMSNTQRQYQAKTLVDMPICEEGETSPENYSSPHTTPIHKPVCDLAQKRALVSAVTDAVEKMIHHFSPATDQCELNALGDSEITPTCAKLALSCLCPSLYAVLSDGLKPTLETSFGAIGNSVWQVVEASAHQGPLTKALNELVMRINAEDAITEGLVKFNAFVFGLLNVRSLDAWASFLRTRESVIKKHYEPNSLLLMSLTGSASVRGLLDTLIASLQPLALLPFQFDLLFEYRQLHQSLKRIDSYQHLTSPTHTKAWKSGCSSHSNLSDTDDASAPMTILHNSTTSPDKTLPDLLNSSENFKPTIGKQRPRSCIDPGFLSKPSFKLGEDVTTIAKKRWSGISLSSKLYQAYNRLAHDSEEEYTDSLENNHHQNIQQEDEMTRADNLPQDAPESLESNLSDDKPLNGKKFKKLQRKWEMLSGKESTSPPESPTHNKSKIPRPVASPVKPSGIPIAISPSSTKLNAKGVTPKKAITPPGGIVKKVTGTVNKTNNLVKNNLAPKKGAIRTSRLDQLESGDSSRPHATRPSSLPYKPVGQNGKNGKIVPQRRAVSTSVNRKPSPQSQTPKVVRTLSHRLSSESGHLSFNEGEKLKVVLEVDEQWLLCCRGTQKGLVPRSAVIADTSRF